jgi:lipopolysaccharide export LptBFGC system permease protein LptF
MKKLGVLDRYLLRELVLSTLFCQLILCVLVGIVFAMKAVSSGYSLGIVIPWLGDSLLYSMYFTTPMSVMAGCSLSYGKFVADREFTAAVASGISPSRLFLPMMILIIPILMLMMFTQSTLLPELQHRKQDISRFFVKQLENIGDGRKGQIPLDGEGGVIYWEEIRNGTDLKVVFIEKQLSVKGGAAVPSNTAPDETPPTKINAKRAKLSVDDTAGLIRLTLRDVSVVFPVNSSVTGQRDFLDWDHESIEFDQFNVDFPISSRNRRLNDLPTAELTERLGEIRGEIGEIDRSMATLASIEEKNREESRKAGLIRAIRRGETEIWRRRAMALAVLTFALIGAPLALLLRTPQKLVPFFFSLLAVLGVFYPLTYGGVQLSRATEAPAWITVLSGNYILLAMALGMILRLRAR